MTLTIHPGLMPARRPEPQLYVPRIDIEREFHRKPADMRTTIGELNSGFFQENTLRRACDEATDRLYAYGETRWAATSTKNASAWLERWFGLNEHKDEKLPLSPGAFKIVRRIFVQVCLAMKVTGLPVQQDAWYRALQAEIKA